ncbi:MAG: hypothetical protein RIM23_02520 [Coleofasciculus sp. G3-WIS-01]|uniref:hypothetical protein n=1 Tax=Coleofasciculus sp. G3-WIS-01 TaxID=3069528 RepID=UPI003301ACED
MTNDEILAFWFGTPDDPASRKPRQAWFTKNPAFDEEVRSDSSVVCWHRLEKRSLT